VHDILPFAALQHVTKLQTTYLAGFVHIMSRSNCIDALRFKLRQSNLPTLFYYSFGIVVRLCGCFFDE
jgi:hypothetical protein